MAAETQQVSLDDLRSIVGPEHARDAGADDCIDEVPARFLVEPGTVEEAAAVLKLANEAGIAVAPRGGGTKLGLGNPPSRLDLILSTRRLNRLLEHSAGDLVVRAQAGVTLEALRMEVAKAGQQLSLDPPQVGATLGGLVAANPSGPRRLRFGTVRDLLIGITFILPDGTIAKSGGKVVKNVAGYDLQKLFTGSLGTLGLIVEVIFRLHPLPKGRRLVLTRLTDPEAAGEAVQALMHSSLVPSAVELLWEGPGGGRGWLMTLFEGIEQGVEVQASRALELLGPYAGEPRSPDEDPLMVVPEEHIASWWHLISPSPWKGPMPWLKLSYLPATLSDVIPAVEGACQARQVAPVILSHAATGVAGIRVGHPSPDELPALVDELRERLQPLGASVVVLSAPASLKRRMDVWGPVAAPVLMERVKERFDPNGIMNPGRFVGGI